MGGSGEAAGVAGLVIDVCSNKSEENGRLFLVQLHAPRVEFGSLFASDESLEAEVLPGLDEGLAPLGEPIVLERALAGSVGLLRDDLAALVHHQVALCLASCLDLLSGSSPDLASGASLADALLSASLLSDNSLLPGGSFLAGNASLGRALLSGHSSLAGNASGCSFSCHDSKNR